MAKEPTRQSPIRKRVPSSTKTTDAVETSQRETLVTLRAHVDKVEARLKRADTLTRKSVKAIESAFDTLSQKSGSQKSGKGKSSKSGLSLDEQKFTLDVHVRALASQLTDMVEQTRATVTKELGKAVDEPSIERLKAALQMADDRIADTDDRLARSIAGINRHIADMARAIDTQLTAQSHEQGQALLALKSETESSHYALIQRLDDIEEDSADALLTIGEKVAATAKQIKKRSKVYDQKVHARLAEIETKSRIDFEALKVDLDTRVERVEVDQKQATSQRDRGFTGLETRMEGLEFGLNSLMKTVAAATLKAGSKPLDAAPLAAAFEASKLETSDTAFDPIEAPMLPSSKKINFLDRESLAIPHRTQDANVVTSLDTDKIFGVAPKSKTPVAELQPTAPSNNPYSTAPTAPKPMPQRSGGHTPLPYSTATPPAMPQGQFGRANAYAYAEDAAQLADLEAPVQPYLVHTTHPQEYIAPPPAVTAPNALPGTMEFETSALPYENPAYADPNYNHGADQSMARSRPGGFEKKKKKQKKAKAPLNLRGLKVPTLSGQNKKMLMMAVGVTAISLVGIKVLTAKTSDLDANPQSIASATGFSSTSDGFGANAPQSMLEVSEPIGTYQDNQAPIVSDSSSLNAAADAGDPIAQFQLGLSYLQNGRTDEAIQLIRGSADSGLAAAQYRLAKLYETGEGVVEDPVMARSLTERAARSGNRIAMHDLALYYAEGRGGVDLDMVTAAKWFEKAAERGVVDSQFNLGVLYESGQGLPQNLSDAYVWYAIASQQGDQLAAQRIDVLSTQLNPTQKDGADTRVANFKPTRIDNRANGIFKNLPWSKNATAQTVGNSIQKAQSLLAQLGYEAGTPDGAMGPQTRSAIISFERSNGLPETGRVSVELIDRLSLATGA